MAAKGNDGDVSAREIVTTRIFDAPRALVFAAWTDPKHLAEWWGPNGFSTTTSAFEMKTGGAWRFVMHGPDGRDYQNRITYEEIVPGERLVYAHGNDDAREPISFRTTVTFEDLGGKTRLTLRALFPTAEARERVLREHGAAQGARETLDRLASFIAGAPARYARFVKTGARTTTLTRLFDAPRALVFEAWTRPEHLIHWYWASQDWTTPFAEVEPKVGGAFKIGFQGPGGAGFTFECAITELVPNERLSLMMGDGRPATVLFADEGGKTRLTLTFTLEDTFSEEQQREGWGAMLAHLGDYLGTGAKDYRLTLRRTLKAPRALVFAAWTDAKRVAEWWGPDGFTAPRCALDLRPGGDIRIDMQAPGGGVHPMTGSYREIVPGERLVFTSSALDEAGKPIFTNLNTVTFADNGAGTELTVEVRVLMLTTAAGGYLDSHEPGWSQTLDRLTAFVERRA